MAGLLLGSAAPPSPRAPVPVPAVAAPAPAPSVKATEPAPVAPSSPSPTVREEAAPAPAKREVRPRPDVKPWQSDEPGRVKIVVSLPQQKAYVFRDGRLFATSKVSTGKRGHETPAGTFRILQKKVKHRSNRYANAPMPYMQRLTWSGVALHAGHVPGYRASHGCIRLPWSFARKLYGVTDHATEVTVTHARPKSAAAAMKIG